MNIETNIKHNNNNNNNNNTACNNQQESTFEIKQDQIILPQLFPAEIVAIIIRPDLPIPLLSRLNKKYYALSLDLMKDHVFLSIQTLADSIFRIMDYDYWDRYTKKKLSVVLNGTKSDLSFAKSLLLIKTIQFRQLGKAMAILKIKCTDNVKLKNILHNAENDFIRIPIVKAMTLQKIESKKIQNFIKSSDDYLGGFSDYENMYNKIIKLESLFFTLQYTTKEGLSNILEKIPRDQRLKSCISLSISLEKLKQFDKALSIINFLLEDEKSHFLRGTFEGVFILADYLELIIKSLIKKGNIYELLNFMFEKQDVLPNKKFLITLSKYLFLMEQKTIDTFCEVLNTLTPTLNKQEFSDILEGVVKSARKNIKIAEKIMNSADIEYKKEFYRCFFSCAGKEQYSFSQVLDLDKDTIDDEIMYQFMCKSILSKFEDANSRDLVEILNIIPEQIYEKKGLSRGNILVNGTAPEKFDTFIRELIRVKCFKELLDIASVITSPKVVKKLNRYHPRALQILAINLAKSGYGDQVSELVNSISDKSEKEFLLAACKRCLSSK